MGAGSLIALLSWVLALSGLTDWRRGWWRSKHHTESGTQVWGLESKFGRRSGPLDRRVVGWSCLCLRYKRGMCFEVSSWDTLVHELPCDTEQLGYDLAL